VSQTHDEIRALRVMVDELRAEPPPELPWEAMERRLLASIAEQPAIRRFAATPGPRPETSPFARVLGFAAVAAALALAIGSVAGSGEMPVAATPARHTIDAAAVALAPAGEGSPRAHELSALHTGDVVDSGEAAVSFGQAGLVTWTLAPHSVVRVRSTGIGHTLALESGSLRAEVTPRDPAEGLVEAFAVEVEGTRVAVHGTAFSVKREGAWATVDVEHGAVAIGPVGYVGATTGHLLVGPARASFSLDGGRNARLLAMGGPESPPKPPGDVVAALIATPILPSSGGAPTVAAVEEAPTPAAASKPVLAVRAPAHPVAEPPAPEAPSAPPRLTVAVVQGRLDRCFRQHYEASTSGVRVSVASTLSIDVNADGTWSARFSPPLKPEMQDCAGSAMGGRFADGAGHIDIPVSFQP
jgi:FecR protein